jgi:hypothetical protein
VYVFEAHRGRRLSERMVTHATTRPDVGSLSRRMLLTENAHGRYATLGFGRGATLEREMEIRWAGAYRFCENESHCEEGARGS